MGVLLIGIALAFPVWFHYFPHFPKASEAGIEWFNSRKSLSGMNERLIIMKYLALLCVVFLIALATVVAQEDVDISPVLIEQIDAIEDEVMELRGLDELYEVERLFPTQEEAIAYIISETEAELTDAVSLEINQFYIAFDFVGPDVDIVEIYIELLADQIAGFYDPDTQQMNVLLISDEQRHYEL